MKKRFTSAVVRSLISKGPPEDKRQLIVQDTETRGLGLRISTSAASYIFERSVRGRSKRVTIGDAHSWSLEDARKEANRLTVLVDRGDGLDTEKPEEVSVADAMELHIARLSAKGGSQRSIDDINNEMQRYCSDWLSRPIIEIRASDCAKRHDRVTRKHGPASANRLMTIVRAIHNTAGQRFEEWPRNPTRAVAWNRIRRRREPIPWEKLPAWFEAVQSLRNPVRRDYNLVVLFTGLRRTDAATIRWEHIDFEAGTLYRPKPKGGVDRAFTVPLAALVLEILRQRRHDGRTDGGWAFPTRRRDGSITHLQEPTERHPVLVSPHRLRDTFATACLEARIGDFETKCLLNHTLPESDVTHGYQRPSIEHLRGCVERVVGRLLASSSQPLVAIGGRVSPEVSQSSAT